MMPFEETENGKIVGSILREKFATDHQSLRQRRMSTAASRQFNRDTSVSPPLSLYNRDSLISRANARRTIMAPSDEDTLASPMAQDTMSPSILGEEFPSEYSNPMTSQEQAETKSESKITSSTLGPTMTFQQDQTMTSQRSYPSLPLNTGFTSRQQRDHIDMASLDGTGQTVTLERPPASHFGRRSSSSLPRLPGLAHLMLTDRIDGCRISFPGENPREKSEVDTDGSLPDLTEIFPPPRRKKMRQHIDRTVFFASGPAMSDASAAASAAAATTPTADPESVRQV